MSVPQGPLERIDRIVLYVLRKMATDDATVTLRPDCDYSVAYARTPPEFEFLIERAVELEYIELASGGDQYRLRLKGWEHASQLARAQIRSNQAFVAMSFSPGLSSIYYNAIKPALKHCGYLPLRVDQVEYNDKIDDRIVADIRSSGIMVADFTEHKAAVYFESGFAMGLGLEVIRTCRDTDLKDTHFDTRQYNHIVWKDEVDLKDKLIARIQATVPLKHQPRAVSD
jgi:nucleoside 2-deoxyribosyltransferase